MFEQKKYKCSLIIPCWFTKDQHGRYGQHETYFFAQKCLERILEYRKDEDGMEIILIDNGSSLDDGDIPKEWMPVSKFWGHADILIKNKFNLGFGPAVNQGVYVAMGEYIIQMNDDIIVFPNWLDSILEVFKHDELKPPVGVVMPNLIKKEFQNDCLNDSGRLDVFKVIDLPAEKVVLRNEGVYEPGAEFGSLWCMKKNLSDRLIKEDGFFFDPQFLMGMSEDRDLWKRVRVAGFETYRTNLTRVGHVGNCSVGKIKDRKQYTEVNREKLAKKWNK